MSTTTSRRAAALAVAVTLTGVALAGCGRHGAADTTGTATVAPTSVPTTETTDTTVTTAAPAPPAVAVDPAALARLEHDLAGATDDLDTADQQLQAARTESTTDPRG